jgi:hypothetical protein
MGYYIRVLSTSSGCVPVPRLQSALETEKLRAAILLEDDAPDDWTQIVLTHTDGREIASIERDPVEHGKLGSDELEEFAGSIADCKPASAVKWLLDYFPRVRCIYAFQLLSGTDYKNGWEILAAIKNSIWSFAPAILQADGEGFTNEDGYHILWQFSDGVRGKWWMGTLRDGEWKHFQMDLGDSKHRESFLKGELPAGATVV